MVDSGLITVDIDQTIIYQRQSTINPLSIPYQSIIINPLSIPYQSIIINPLSTHYQAMIYRGIPFTLIQGVLFLVDFCLRICKAQRCPLTPEQRKQYDAELQKVG